MTTRRPLPGLSPAAARRILLLAALPTLVLTLASLGERLADPASLVTAGSVAHGEALLHAAHEPSVDLANRLPLNALLETLIAVHGGRWGGVLIVGAFAAALSASVLALATGLASLASGLLALGLWARLDLSLPAPPGFYKMSLLAPLVVLCACALAARARRPSARSSAALALCLGATFMSRSVLAFFPPLMALYELAVLRRFAWRRCWKDLTLAYAAPYLALVPWTLLHWDLSGRFVLFETTAAGINIVLGVLGALSGGNLEPAAFAPSGLFRWALEEVARHPLRYAAGFAERLLFVARLHPVLLAFAAAGLWVNRRREEFRQVGLLCAYYLLAHCAMAVIPDYFYPLWPILCALAASCLPPLLAAREAPRTGAPAPLRAAAAGGAALAAALLALAWGSLAHYAVQARRRPPASARAVAEAADLHPRDPWLLYLRGRQRQERGDAAGGLSDLREAAAAGPRIPRVDLELALAQARAGADARLLNGDFSHRPGQSLFDDQAPLQAPLYRTLGLLRRGRRAEARAALGAAFESWRGGYGLLEVRNPRERELDLRARSGIEARYLDFLETALRGKPAAEILDLVHELLEARPGDAALRLAAVRTAARLGDDRRARAWLKPGMALPAARTPDEPEFWLERAQAALSAGDPRRAERALDEAAALPALRPGTVASLARSYSRAGAHAKALVLFRRATRDDPAAAELWIARGRAASAAGDRDEALASLARAEVLAPAPPERRTLAFAYQDARAWDKAEAVLRSLDPASFGRAALLKDLGVLRYLRGDEAGALRTLRLALRVDPGSTEARDSVRAILSARKR